MKNIFILALLLLPICAWQSCDKGGNESPVEKPDEKPDEKPEPIWGGWKVSNIEIDMKIEPSTLQPFIDIFLASGAVDKTLDKMGISKDTDIAFKDDDTYSLKNKQDTISGTYTIDDSMLKLHSEGSKEPVEMKYEISADENILSVVLPVPKALIDSLIQDIPKITSLEINSTFKANRTTDTPKTFSY